MNAIEAMAQTIIEPMTPAERKQRQRDKARDKGGRRIDITLSAQASANLQKIIDDYELRYPGLECELWRAVEGAIWRAVSSHPEPLLEKAP